MKHLNNLQLQIYSSEIFNKSLIFMALPGESAPSSQATPEQPIPSKDHPVLSAAAKEAAEKARLEAIRRGRESARSLPVTTDPGKKLDQKPEPPKLPDQIKGLKCDVKKAKVDGESKSVEQPFEFGDEGKVKGHINFPHPPSPHIKTTYVFNYVDNLSSQKPEDQKKLLAEIRKQQASLGNTVVITMQTPEGTTTVDGKQLDTMQTMMSEIEKFQKDHPEFKDMARPDRILHMTTKGSAQRVQKLLTDYNKLAQPTDSRANAELPILNTEKLEEQLPVLIQRLSEPTSQPSSTPSTPSTPPTTSSGSRGVSGSGSSGGMSAGSSSSIASPSPATSPSSPSTSSSSETPSSSTPVESKDSQEKSDKVNKLLVIGDSLLFATQKSLQAKQKVNHVRSPNWGDKETVQVSKSVVNGGKDNPSMVSIAKELDTNGQMETLRGGKLVLLGGTNDLQGDKEKVLEGLKTIWSLAKKHGIKVYGCTIPPINQDGQYYKSNYHQANGNRRWLNEQIMGLRGQSDGPDEVIKLHLPLSQGGVADENDENRLHTDMKATDGLHPTAGVKGKGSDLMATQIQTIIGPADQDESPKTTEASANTPVKTTSSKPEQPVKATGSGWEYVKDHKKVSKLAQEYQGRWKSEGKAVGYHEEVEFDGKKYLLTVAAHDLQARTGKRIPRDMFEQARRQNWPINLVPSSWFYAVEVKEKNS